MADTSVRELWDAAAAARAFVAARLRGEPLDAYPGAAPQTLKEAYDIQDEAIDLWPADVVGWKIGLVQPQHRAAYGGVERIAGPIFADNLQAARAGGAVIEFPVFVGGFAAVEAEFVLRLGDDAPATANWTPNAASELVDAMFVGVECAGSPYAQINDRGPAVTASDFGNNAGLVLGPEIAHWRDVPLTSFNAEMRIDGVAAGRGDASSIPNGPFAALAFLLGVLAERGRPLKAGQYVSTGAVTGVHPIDAGQLAEVDFGALGVIRCRAVDAQRFAASGWLRR